MQQILDETDVPPHFICPISLEIMSDPVTLCTGQTYDRKSIQKWLDTGHKTCPSTMQKLSDFSLTPNHPVSHLIQDWSLQGREKQRMAHEETLKVLIKNLQECKVVERADALRAIQVVIKEHEFLRRTFIRDAGVALLSSFVDPDFISHAVPSEILSILVQLPLDATARKALADPANLSWIVHLLQRGCLHTRENAAKVIEALLESQDVRAEIGSRSEVLFELKRLLKEKRHSTALAAGLSLLRTLMNSREITTTWVVPDGFVVLLVELLPYANPKCAEMALNILDMVSTTEEGRVAVKDCPTTISNLTGTLIRVSEKCTLYALLILLAVFRLAPEDSATSAMHSGLPGKLLLVIQSSCSRALKKRCLELLKLLSEAGTFI